jgi:hypothetical protein
MAEELAKATPNSVKARFAVARSLVHLATLAERDRDIAAVRAHLTAANARLDAMNAEGQIAGFAGHRAVYADVRSRLEALSATP